MESNQELADPDTTPWPERVELTLADFTGFYRMRGQIVHGSDVEGSELSSARLKKAREIAHSSLLAYSYLARVFEWKTDRQAKDWFKSPEVPPKEVES